MSYVMHDPCLPVNGAEAGGTYELRLETPLPHVRSQGHDRATAF